MNDSTTQRSSESLRRRLRHYYQRHELPLDTLLELKQMIVDTPRTEGPLVLQQIRVHNQNVRASWLLVGVLAVLISSIGIVGFFLQSQEQTRELEAIASEIALNHNNQFGMDVMTSEIHQLAETMSALDFAPIEPTRLQEVEFNVLGGRYCTVGNAIASWRRI